MENKFIKGFIPLTIKSKIGLNVLYVNIDNILTVGDYGAGTCIEHGIEHSYIVQESVDTVMKRILLNRNGQSNSSDNINL